MPKITTERKLQDLQGEMTDKQFKLAQNILSGMKSGEAAKEAGYSSHACGSQQLTKHPVSTYIALKREVIAKKVEEGAIIDKKRVLQVLSEIVEGDVDNESRVPAVREMAKILGWYEPEKVELTENVTERIRKEAAERRERAFNEKIQINRN